MMSSGSTLRRILGNNVHQPLDKESDRFLEVKRQLGSKLLTELSPDLQGVAAYKAADEIIHAVLADEKLALTDTEQVSFFKRLWRGLWGFGEFECLMRDCTVRRIIVASPNHVYVQRDEAVEQIDVQLGDSARLLFAFEGVLYPDQHLNPDVAVETHSVHNAYLLTILRPPSADCPVVIIERCGDGAAHA